MCENIYFSPIDPLPFLRQPLAFLAKKTVDKDNAAKTESVVKLPVKIP